MPYASLKYRATGVIEFLQLHFYGAQLVSVSTPTSKGSQVELIEMLINRSAPVPWISNSKQLVSRSIPTDSLSFSLPRRDGVVSLSLQLVGTTYFEYLCLTQTCVCLSWSHLK